MRHRKPDDETLGIRVYQVNRQRAVDRALDRTRHGLHADWHYLTTDDHENLRWIVGELWATISRDEWETLHFSKLDLHGVRKLVGIGDRLRRHGTNRVNALQSAEEILREVSGAEESAAEQPSMAY